MKDEERTKEQLVHELAGVRQRIAALEALESEHKRSEEALRQAEEKYRSIFENAVEGIFQTTPDGHYLRTSPALARVYGYESPEELIQTLTDIGPQLYLEPTRRAEIIRLMEEGNLVSGFESQVYRKGGSVTWISESVRVIQDESGEVLFYEGTVEDITDRKRAEKALPSTNVELQETRRYPTRLK